VKIPRRLTDSKRDGKDDFWLNLGVASYTKVNSNEPGLWSGSAELGVSAE